MKDKIKRLVYSILSLFENRAEGAGSYNSDALAYLQTQHPQKETSFVAENQISADADLLVVVPVYNVEKYIQKCIDSIFAQKTKYSVQIVIVDDGATDTSGKMADQYAAHENITVLHKKNGGLSDARNYGMKQLRGRYLFFVDSDDYIPSSDAFERMLDAAYKKNADIVAGNFLRFVVKGSQEEQTVDRKLERFQHLDDIDPIKDLQGFAWGKLYKAELFESICFPAGYWYEDTIIPWLVFSKVDKAVYADVMCYAYRNNPNGITAAGLFSPRAIESTYITKRLLETIPKEMCKREEVYSLFIIQTFINIQRVRNADDKTICAVFSIMCDLKQAYFAGMHLDGSVSYKEKEIEKTLNERNYSRMKRILRWL